MPHSMPPGGIPKSKPVHNMHISGQATIRCFPNERVEYALNLERITPGARYRVDVFAIFKVKGKETNLSQKASFFIYKQGVEGVPSGPATRTGISYPSEGAFYNVDDFEIVVSTLKLP